MDNNIIMVILFILVLVLIINGVIIRKYILDANLKNSKEINELNEKMNNNLLLFQNTITNNFKMDFDRLNNATEERLVMIEKNVHYSMNQSLVSTNDSFLKIQESLVKMDNTKEVINSLSSSINDLQNILKDKKSRGIFGEVELYTLLEREFGDNHYFYDKQKTIMEGRIADAVLYFNNRPEFVCIDSKFPLENYNKMYQDGLTKEEKEHYKKLFKNDVQFKIKDIASKYIIKGLSVDYAYMFIPSEAVYSEIYASLDEVVEYSYQNHVYLVSPTTLMALLTTMKALYLEYEKQNKIDVIQNELIKLSKQFELYNERFIKINNDFNKVYKDFDELSITNRKIMEKFNNIENVKIEKDESNY